MLLKTLTEGELNNPNKALLLLIKSITPRGMEVILQESGYHGMKVIKVRWVKGGQFKVDFADDNGLTDDKDALKGQNLFISVTPELEFRAEF